VKQVVLVLLSKYHIALPKRRQHKIRSIAAVGYKAKGDEVRISGFAAK
jgi:hypothetical protein